MMVAWKDPWMLKGEKEAREKRMHAVEAGFDKASSKLEPG